MSIIETTVTFSNKGEEIKRLEKKNKKYALARSLVDIYHITYDEELNDKQKIDAILSIAAGSYWGC